MRALISFVALASVAGCSLLTDLTDLGTTPDAQSGDALQETSTTESGADGGSDGGSDCGHLFCEDFDLGIFSKWDAVVFNGEKLNFSSDAISLPNSLAALIATTADAPGPSLSKSFALASKIHLELDLKGTCASTESDLVVFDLAPPVGYSSMTLALYQSPSFVHIAQSAIFTDGGVDNPDGGDQVVNVPVFSSWHHFKIDVDFALQTFNVTYAIDGGTTTTGLALIPPLAPSAFKLVIGVPYHGVLVTGCVVNFDNITVD